VLKNFVSAASDPRLRSPSSPLVLLVILNLVLRWWWFDRFIVRYKIDYPLLITLLRCLSHNWLFLSVEDSLSDPLSWYWRRFTQTKIKLLRSFLRCR